MTIDSNVLIACFITAAAVSLMTYLISVRFITERVHALLERDFEKKRNQVAAEAQQAATQGEAFDAMLEREYLKGKEHGAKEELAKFSVTYEPYTEVAEEWLGVKKTAEIGYDVQMHYGPFMIGEATRKVVRSNIKYDQAVIDNLLNNEVTASLRNFSELLLTKGMKARVESPKTKGIKQK